MIERQRPYLAVYCVILRGDAILTMKRANTGYSDGLWSVPSGHVDDGESLSASASRELMEETGLMVDEGDWGIVCTMHRRTDQRQVIDIFLAASTWNGVPTNREPDKCSDIRFVPLWDLPAETLPYVARALQPLSSGAWDRRPHFIEEGW